MTNPELSPKISEMPTKLHLYLRNKMLYDVSSHSGALVLKVGNDFFLKVDAPGKLAKEAKLTHYFFTHDMGVEVIDYISTDKDYLLTKAAMGSDATSFLDQPESVCMILGKTLRDLHQLRPKGFPQDRLLDAYRQTSKINYQKGVFYQKALLPHFNISGKDEAIYLVQDQGHLLETNAFIHGDACLPNIILKDSQTFSTFIDWGLSGYSEKHVDIFWAIWSIHYNLADDKYIDVFLDSYSREEIDWDKLKIVAAHEAFGD
ncbi:phosphotransferase [Streptococcus jiangjianxini]|uniref:phosphotransferase n=1 Tax=Streptococcus jiangjianxini TaxID=3161189 RepID=UPI0032ED58A1